MEGQTAYCYCGASESKVEDRTVLKLVMAKSREQAEATGERSRDSASDWSARIIDRRSQKVKKVWAEVWLNLLVQKHP